MPLEGAGVLIVDDHYRISRLLSAALSRSGYWVRTATDGFSALVEIRYQVPDILLSDLNMPGMSGFELLSVVRRRFSAIQVIAMSSMFSRDNLPVGVADDAYYEKGANLRSLLQILDVLTQPEPIRAQRQPLALAPIWIPMNGHDPAGEPYVMISCPECLRTFQQMLNKDACTVRETVCTHCAHIIHYAIVRLPTASSRAFLRT